MEDQWPVPAHEACQGEDKCPTEPISEPELQEERLKLEEERFKQEEALEERVSTVRPSHGSKRKLVRLTAQEPRLEAGSSGLLSPSLPGPTHQAHPRAEAELPQGLPLHREEPEGSQSEPSPTAKQHKKAKKRRSLGAPVLPAMAGTVSAPSETLQQERKAQRLRPLYQYINYCNPELNQAGEGDREAEAVVQTELELAPEEAGVEQLQALPPMAEQVTVPSTLVAHLLSSLNHSSSL